MTKLHKQLLKLTPRSNLEGPATLSSAHSDDILSQSRDYLGKLEPPKGVSRTKFNAARKRLIDTAPKALETFVENPDETALAPDHRFALEAIVRADGSRNSLYFKDDALDLTSEQAIGDELFTRAETTSIKQWITRAAQSVGRLDFGLENPQPIGTCFALSENLVATNRHVLQAIALPDPGDWGNWHPFGDVTVNFRGERDEDGEPGFKVNNVAFTGTQQIPPTGDPELLDFAILEVEPLNGAKFPRAMTFDQTGTTDRLKQDKRLYVIGFPTQKSNEAENDLAIVFGGSFGVKQWAPGHVLEEPGHPDDPRHWAFTHDASTLPGSSGSLIMDFEAQDNPTALGIHFSGQSGVENSAHVLAELKSFMLDNSRARFA